MPLFAYMCPKSIRVTFAKYMKTKKKAIRRVTTNDIDLGKNRLPPNVDGGAVQLDLFGGQCTATQSATIHPCTDGGYTKHSTSQKQKECHTLPLNYDCGEGSAMLLREPLEPMVTHTDTERSTQMHDAPAEIPGTCAMEVTQTNSTATLDMHPTCHTRPASSMDKGKRKVFDVYNEQQLLCSEDLFIIDAESPTVTPQDRLHHAQCFPLLPSLDNSGTSSTASHNTSPVIPPSNDLNLSIQTQPCDNQDYIGRVQYVTEIQKSFKATTNSTVWRDIGVQNLDGQTVRFTLWNQDAHNFRKQEYEKAKKPTIIAVSSCSVKEYGGLQLSATNATEYYFNPDIPEYHEICSVYDEFFDPPAILNVQYERCADPHQEKFRNRVTLADLAKENPQNQQNVRFTVDATIDKIITQRPWFFKKCSDCKLKISDQWSHTHCKQPPSEDGALYSYCFRLELSDGTANVIMICFSNEANSMVKDCKEVLRTMPKQDSYDYPPELLSLQGKKKIFQLHFHPDSTKDHQLFVLDTCWDGTPLLPSANPITTESTMDSFTTNATQSGTVNTTESPTKMDTKANITISEGEAGRSLDIKQTHTTPPTEQPKPVTVTAETKTPGPLDLKETQATTTIHTPAKTPAEQEPLSETSKPIKQSARKSTRRPLFTAPDDGTTTSGSKKTKKEE